MRGDLLRMAEDSWPLLERMGPRPGVSLDRLTFHNQTDAADTAVISLIGWRTLCRQCPIRPFPCLLASSRLTGTGHFAHAHQGRSQE